MSVARPVKSGFRRARRGRRQHELPPCPGDTARRFVDPLADESVAASSSVSALCMRDFLLTFFFWASAGEETRGHAAVGGPGPFRILQTLLVNLGRGEPGAIPAVMIARAELLEHGSGAGKTLRVDVESGEPLQRGRDALARRIVLRDSPVSDRSRRKRSAALLIPLERARFRLEFCPYQQRPRLPDAFRILFDE